MNKKGLLLLFLILFLLLSTFVVVVKSRQRQTINSSATPLPTPAGYIPPTPLVPGDWNYDGVVNEQDEALSSH